MIWNARALFTERRSGPPAGRAAAPMTTAPAVTTAPCAPMRLVVQRVTPGRGPHGRGPSGRSARAVVLVASAPATTPRWSIAWPKGRRPALLRGRRRPDQPGVGDVGGSSWWSASSRSYADLAAAGARVHDAARAGGGGAPG